MPALTDVQQLPIRSAAETGRAHPVHPSPSRDGLALEILSPREIGWWGRRFGIDTPYMMVPLGWGEWEPLFGLDVADFALEVASGPPGALFATSPPRPPSGAQPFVFTQAAPVTTWTIAHNLGRFPAAIAIWGDDGALHSAVVEHSDMNTATATFNTPLSGTAVVI